LPCINAGRSPITCAVRSSQSAMFIARHPLADPSGQNDHHAPRRQASPASRQISAAQDRVIRLIVSGVHLRRRLT
jgi:hypothetical protein